MPSMKISATAADGDKSTVIVVSDKEKLVAFCYFTILRTNVLSCSFYSISIADCIVNQRFVFKISVMA